MSTHMHHHNYKFHFLSPYYVLGTLYFKSSEELCGLFYRWEGWSSEQLSEFPKATQLEKDRTKIQISLPKSSPFYHAATPAYKWGP